jgi:hypothetical protein
VPHHRPFVDRPGATGPVPFGPGGSSAYRLRDPPCSLVVLSSLRQASRRVARPDAEPVRVLDPEVAEHGRVREVLGRRVVRGVPMTGGAAGRVVVIRAAELRRSVTSVAFAAPTRLVVSPSVDPQLSPRCPTRSSGMRTAACSRRGTPSDPRSPSWSDRCTPSALRDHVDTPFIDTWCQAAAIPIENEGMQVMVGRAEVAKRLSLAELFTGNARRHHSIRDHTRSRTASRTSLRMPVTNGTSSLVYRRASA